MSSSELNLVCEDLAGRIEADDLESVGAGTRRRLFTALVRAFALEAGVVGGSVEQSRRSPIDEGVLATEEVAVTVAAMMRSAGVTSFEMAALFNV